MPASPVVLYCQVYKEVSMYYVAVWSERWRVDKCPRGVEPLSLESEVHRIADMLWTLYYLAEIIEFSIYPARGFKTKK